MGFCGNCGAPIENGDLCPRCSLVKSKNTSAPVSTSVSSKKDSGMKKVFAAVAVAIAVVITIIVIPHTVDKPCDWCNRRPSMEFKTSDGSMAYVCKDCSKECAWCGKKATKHYENLLGMIVFVCNDCYKEVTNN